ncbi:hypothetical protein Hte_009508 [Hypoxylon texense]
MPRLKIIPLHHLFYKGFKGGLQWETRGDVQTDGKTNYRFLLQHPHAFHLSKVLTKGLRSTQPLIVSLALSDIYEYATDNVDLCSSLEPIDFFGQAKDSFKWSKSMTKEALWAFTYKAFHARQLFLMTVLRPGEEPQENVQPLVKALDAFRDAFLEFYPVDHATVDGGSHSTLQEDIERVNDEVHLNEEIRNKYFPRNLTHHTAEGDGTDKLITKFKRVGKYVPQPQQEPVELDLSGVPDEELFYYTTECKPKYRDAFKDVPRSKDGPVDSPKTGGLQPAGSKRGFNSFLDYRESRNGDEEGDEGDGGDTTGGIKEEEEEELPDIKKLKISDDPMEGIGQKEEEVPDVKKLKISDD